MTARRAATIVAALTVVGALVRVPGLDTGLWHDEIVTLVLSVRPPLHEIIRSFGDLNNHPFHSLLAHLSVRAAGEHIWTLRLPTFLFGVAGIPLLYALGATLATRAEGVMAATLLTVSYHDVWFSQNARGYTMLLFFTMLVTLLAVRLMERPQAGGAVVYGLTVAFGLYTHLTMGFVVVAHVAVWAWRLLRVPEVDRARLIRVAGTALAVAGVAAALLYGPMVSAVFAILSKPQPAASVTVATPAWAVLETLRGLRVGFGTVGVLAVFALAGLGGLDYLRRQRDIALLLFLPAIVAVPVMLAAGVAMRPRFFFSFLGFALLMLVRGAMETGRAVQRRIRFQERRPWMVGVALVVLTAAISAESMRDNYKYPKQDFDAALRFVERSRLPGEPVATGGLARLVYDWYYEKPWTQIATADDLEDLCASAERVWIVYSFEDYMDRRLVNRIREGCQRRQVFPGTLSGGEVIVSSCMRRAD